MSFQESSWGDASGASFFEGAANEETSWGNNDNQDSSSEQQSSWGSDTPSSSSATTTSTSTTTHKPKSKFKSETAPHQQQQQQKSKFSKAKSASTAPPKRVANESNGSNTVNNNADNAESSWGEDSYHSTWGNSWETDESKHESKQQQSETGTYTSQTPKKQYNKRKNVDKIATDRNADSHSNVGAKKQQPQKKQIDQPQQHQQQQQVKRKNNNKKQQQPQHEQHQQPHQHQQPEYSEFVSDGDHHNELEYDNGYQQLYIPPYGMEAMYSPMLPEQQMAYMPSGTQMMDPQQYYAYSQQVAYMQQQQQMMLMMQQQQYAPYDTRLTDCSFFLQGQCGRGDTCLYRHNAAARSNPVCRYWKTGTCRNIACVYKHPKPSFEQESPVPVSPTQLSPSPSPQLKKDKVCQFYLQGNCTKGASCSFVHPGEEGEQKVAAVTEDKSGDVDKKADKKNKKAAKRKQKQLEKKQQQQQEQQSVLVYDSASILPVAVKNGQCFFLVGREGTSENWTSIGGETADSDRESTMTAARAFSEITKYKFESNSDVPHEDTITRLQKELKFQRSTFDPERRHRMFIAVVPYVEKALLLADEQDSTGIVDVEWITLQQLLSCNWEGQQFTPQFSTLVSQTKPAIERLVKQLETSSKSDNTATATATIASDTTTSA
jgi:hypothetical protein